jgi:hypothetical protein
LFFNISFISLVTRTSLFLCFICLALYMYIWFSFNNKYIMSSGFRSSCYWTDWNWVNTENNRIGLVFAVFAQWKFLYYIDRFDHIKINKSKLINKVCYIYLLLKENQIYMYKARQIKHKNRLKEKSREILDWLINKGIITWCFSYWPSYRSSVCCIGQYEKHHVIIL